MNKIPVSLKRDLGKKHKKYLGYYSHTIYDYMNEEDGRVVNVNHFKFPSEELTQEFLNDVGGMPWGEHQAVLWTTRITAKEFLNWLLDEAQERFPIGSEVPREEIIAWLDSRATHLEIL